MIAPWIVAVLAATGVCATPKASSELKNTEGVKFTAANAFDGMLSTAWAEADEGAAGAWIELKLDKPAEIGSVSIWPGNLADGRKSVKEYGRPKSLTVTVMTKGEPVTVTALTPDLVNDGPQRIDLALPEPVVATSVRVTIDDGDDGYVYDGTYIAEIGFDLGRSTQPDAVEKHREWLASDASLTARNKNEDSVLGWFELAANAEIGNVDMLSKIMAQAADGAPFVRDHAKAVPLGWRVQAIPADETAVDALLKLKNPNAIPAMAMAALRSPGKRGRELAEQVEYFEAYADMLGGGRKNLAAWGETGWESGAIRTFGEPLPIIVDVLGNVLVADVGNSRVQRFTELGVVDKAWGGGEPGITDAWFPKRRKYYVSGAAPGEEPGRFEVPIDLTRIPGKDADGFAVLDMKGRVRVFDESGAATASWKLRTDDTVDSGVGGAAFLEYTGGKIVVAWGSEAFVYTLAGEEATTFKITDGAPNGATALKGGKVGFIVADKLVMYSVDGYRHGEVQGTGNERGEGYEDWDATLDAKGKLWFFTDEGTLVKHKKPGKVDWVVQVPGAPFDHPRIAVKDDVVWIADRDHVERVDALELHARALAQAEAAKATP
jgi:hypothetical protein